MLLSARAFGLTGQLYEDVFQLRLLGGELGELEARVLNGGDDVRCLRLTGLIGELQFARSDQLRTKRGKMIGQLTHIFGQHHVHTLAVQFAHQIFRFVERNHLAVIDDGDLITELFGFFQVV